MFSELEGQKGSLLIDFDENGFDYCFTIYKEGNAVTVGGHALSLEEVAAAVREQVEMEQFDEYIGFFSLIGMGGVK